MCHQPYPSPPHLICSGSRHCGRPVDTPIPPNIPDRHARHRDLPRTPEQGRLTVGWRHLPPAEHRTAAHRVRQVAGPAPALRQTHRTEDRARRTAAQRAAASRPLTSPTSGATRGRPKQAAGLQRAGPRAESTSKKSAEGTESGGTSRPASPRTSEEHPTPTGERRAAALAPGAAPSGGDRCARATVYRLPGAVQQRRRRPLATRRTGRTRRHGTVSADPTRSTGATPRQAGGTIRRGASSLLNT